jgi:bifunctional non-homologous end joining protein LigD
VALEKYKKKRDFRVTPEPAGAKPTARRRGGALAYVIQKHAASRLHYDFRLELDGVLLSWAVPKGPCLDPAEKRLAVQVEDHPLEYGGFEGIIPQGQYGGGTVLLWDRGTWEPLVDPAAGLRKGKLEFVLHGEKLAGEWHMVRMHTRDGSDKNWLLMKSRDEYARPLAKHDVTRAEPKSVASGRDLEAIAKDRKAKRWTSAGAFESTGKAGAPKAAAAPRAGRARARLAAKPATKTATTKSAAAKSVAAKSVAQTPAGGRRAKGTDALALPGARKAQLPAFVPPQLATLVTTAPSGDEWFHETKFDGYRMLCRIDGREVRWLSRNRQDWSDRLSVLTPAARALPVRTALFDGEVVVLGSDGVSDFQALQNELREGTRARLTYFAFDLLHLDGVDLRGVALRERKRLLEPLLPERGALLYSAHIAGDGVAIHAQACTHALEGIVAKRANDVYHSGRDTSWRKVKCTSRQEFVVGGWTEPEGARTGFGALLLGYHDDTGALRFAGRVGTGFDERTLREVMKRLRKATRTPFSDPPRGVEARGVHWVEPRLVVEVEFGSWTSDGKLRHASFEGVREDKPASEIVRERPRALGEAAPATRARRAQRPAARTTRAPAKAAKAARRKQVAERPAAQHGPKRATRGDAEVAGVRISHPERVIDAESGTTKLAYAQFVAEIAEQLLPHVERRAVSLVRCPDGVGGEVFFQRHRGTASAEHVHEIADRESGRSYVWIDSVQGLVSLAQMNVLELHPWGTRIDDLDKPDRIVFDLDPAPDVAWKRVGETALRMRELLGAVGLESFAKTTGGKGLHVVVPLTRKQGWDVVKDFSQSVALALERAAPELYLSKASKAARTGKIFVDWLRNSRTATAVAAYSPRARPGLTVAMPVSWDDVKRGVTADAFDVGNTLAKLARRRSDPWRGFFAVRQTISASARRSFGELGARRER